MKAVRLTKPGAALQAMEVQSPRPADGEVVIRIEAAGICHSDAHYRSGDPATRVLPITLGHEIAGIVAATGPGVDAALVGQRVAVHYVISDGVCGRCLRFGEQFCENYDMLGMTRDGGYAEMVVVPAGNAVPVPAEIALDHAAVMMCSSATSLHALRRGRLREGESVAVFGAGGLGMSAVQLAFALGARRVVAVDIDDARLEMAAGFGAVPVPAAGDPAEVIRGAGGADVALALVGNSAAFSAALRSLGTRGRLVAVGIGRDPVPVAPYGDLILGEHELIGSNDHTLAEIHDLFAFAQRGSLVLDEVVTDRIPLEAGSINEALDRLDGFGPGLRAVITPALEL